MAANVNSVIAARPFVASVPLAWAPRARTTDEDVLLQVVGTHVADTDLASHCVGKLLDCAEVADCAQLMTRNLRTQERPIVWASGNFFVDTRGKIFLDFCAQTQNLNFGHNHPYLTGAAARFFQSTSPYYTSSKFGNLPSLRLAQRLSELLPPELSRINLKMLNGADAVETALKAALKYQAAKSDGPFERRKIISLRWAHHGQSAMTMATSSKYAHLPYVCSRDNIHIEPNDVDALRKYARASAGAAALLVEPLQMNGGSVPLTQTFMEEARRLCDEEDIALIFDEIQTAFGWTGRLFGFEHYGVIPDIACFSKGFASGFPLAAAVMREKYDLLDFGEAEFTGGLNPLSATVALANIELLTGTDVMGHASIMGQRLRTGLEALRVRFPAVLREVRGLGLMLGLETASYTIAKTIYDRALAKGVLLRISKDAKGETILFKPSLIVTAKQIDKVLEVLDHEFTAIG